LPGPDIEELLLQFETNGPQAASALEKLTPWFVAVDRDAERGAPIDDDTAMHFGYAAIDFAGLAHRPPTMRTALETLERAANLTRLHELGDEAVEVELNLAHVLRAGGRNADAESRLQRAVVDLADAVANLPMLYVELAECARTRGDRRAAQTYIERGAAICEASKGRRDPDLQRTCEGYIVGERAQILIDLGLTDRAAPLVAREIELLGRDPEPDVRAACLLHECALLSASDKHERIVDKLRDVLASSEAAQYSPSPRAELRYFFGSALAEQVHEKPELAGEAKVALLGALAETALSSRSKWTAQAHVADLDRRAGDFAAATRELQAVRATFIADATDPGADSAWLTALEARLALDSGADKATRERLLVALEADFTNFLDEWSAAPERSEGIGFLLYSERRAILVELVRLLLDVRERAAGSLAALDRLVRAQGLGSLARFLGGDDVKFEIARRELCSPRVGVLEFLPGPERSFVFAYDDEHLLCEELAASRTWEQDRRDWLVLLSQPPRSGGDRQQRRRQIADSGARLAQALLPAATRELLRTWDEVAIVGIDLLGCTPFDALPLDEHATLGQSLATTYLPSLTVGSRLLKRAGPGVASSLQLTVLAAPTDPSDTGDLQVTWTPIAWNADHERELRRVYGTNEVQVFVGDAASLCTLRGLSNWGGGGVLEFVAHGFYQPASEPPSGIALAPCTASKGLIHAADLERLAVGPLVVLAVCGAGRTPLRSGDDGVSNLGGAFMKAGAQCVVLSPVDLEQGATELLLDEFHAQIARGESPARAMRAARRKLSADERYSDPFYNSMLQVVGLGWRPLVSASTAAAPPAAPTASLRFLLLSLLAAACVALALVWRARRLRARLDAQG
jgi:hypothetical protein